MMVEQTMQMVPDYYSRFLKELMDKYREKESAMSGMKNLINITSLKQHLMF